MSVAITTARMVLSSTHLITSLLPSTIPSVYCWELMSFLTASIVLFITCSSTSTSSLAPLSLPIGGRLFNQLKQTLALLKLTAAALPSLFGPLLAPGSLPYDHVMMIPLFWSIFMPLIQGRIGSSQRFLMNSIWIYLPVKSIVAASFGSYFPVYRKLWM